MKRTVQQRLMAVVTRYSIFFFTGALLCMATTVHAQDKHMVQVKTFDQQLQPMKNVEVSINGREFVSVGSKGSAFIELSDSDLPVKSVRLSNDQLEAASWNYSKGTLEVIVRKKSYQVTPWFVRDKSNAAVANAKITYAGKKTVTVSSNASGKFELPLALDEQVGAATQFSIPGYRIISLKTSETENVLIAERIDPSPRSGEGGERSKPGEAGEAASKPAAKEYFKNFDLSMLDSIQSITVFYAVFKNYQMRDLSPEMKAKLDAKFNSLVKQLEDSVIRVERTNFIGRISDSSLVAEDIKNLLEQVRLEGKMLEDQRTEFDQKIKLIQDKLVGGVENMDAATRARLLSDLTLLELLLRQNESLFFKNQNDYRQIIDGIKEKFFNLEHLENKLSESEAQRLEEQRVFRRQLMIILGVAGVFAILIVLLVRFSIRLRKQKKELVEANAEIKRINENLEGLVAERTKLLAEAHRELDTFLYRASHDLRSPVCSIIGLCNIAYHLSSGESRDLIDRVVQTTIGMDKLLKKLSIISEINQPSNFSSITLLEVVENTWYNYSKTVKDNRVKFVIDCPGDLMINSYPNLIEAILANLIENAIYYSMMKGAENARIEFTASIKGDQVEFSLLDNGIGVDNAIHNRLFDMFFKGHEQSKGNGLGLYIVRKSVQALEGTIAVESVPDKFARFVVRLPLKEAPVVEVAVATELQLS
ncbi:HAMP domain-containing histidine kinase [Fulvivirgaceae bacterium PWU4]|uniref:histidine kinase n=1 Tax=Chryseosolibacter histidini TaxID=2782349 RepID=A0AAP2DKN7_9BACT|nr:ATP-binding protein [Chryseosolibacter histidini]MBT1698105.1 HAMP domain-containing histidine kinase [Chryseosolibacter histidini]